ncbi:MAG: 2-hydroxyacyl-CoA dehydratase [Subdoligranulum sp.]
MSKTIYYACKYAPLELFAGYGATFSALDPLAESFSCAERCAHANLCGYAKAVLEQVEQSGIRALVLTNCCDAMLRVYDVLAASGKMEFLQLLPVPHQSTPATRARFARDLRRLADALQRYTGQEFDAQRAHAFFVHTPHAEGPHLTLLGAHGGSVLYDTVQKAFALPVVDATCTGNRELADVAPAALEDFLPGYAAALLGQIPCMRMDAPVSERAALVDGQTVGIVYHTVQFCDYYAPGLTAPEQFHLPVLKIETDCSRQTFTSGGGQLSTRLGAFAESLNAVPDTENKEAPAMNTNAQYAAGIDSGSASTDAVILDRSGKICGWAIVPTGAGAATGARQALEQALTMAGIAESDLGSRRIHRLRARVPGR